MPIQSQQDVTQSRADDNDVRRLLRAYALLAGCCDDQRALVGRVSRDWIGTESEHLLELAKLPTAALLSPRGREILADELYADPDQGPEDIGPHALDELARRGPIWINSNRLPKLEPTVNAAVLAGVLLTGIQLYGRRGRGRVEIGNDLIVASLAQGTIGLGDRFSAFDPAAWQIIDGAVLSERFGTRIADLATALKAALDDFAARVDAGRDPAPAASPAQANAIAAIMVGRLRLTARAAGDQIFSYLTDSQRAEVEHGGLRTSGAAPEMPYLRRDYRRARIALAQPGVDRHALREPIGNTLMIAVEDTLQDPAKAPRLVGRRGKAVHEVHLNLPLMEYYSPAEQPDGLATLHVAALEMMRYLDKCRRKSFTTMLGHAFQISGILEQTMGAALDPSNAAAALLHDVVEDGAHSVAGYDQSLQKLRLRFGGPLAAMVSEVTDSDSNQDGRRKAQTTHRHASLLLPRKQYDVGRFTAMPLRPTDADTPYTLAGIVVKLADTIATEDEGLRDPDLMSGWWRNSGIRIYWAQNVRGPIVAPLQARLVEEIEQARKGTHYGQRESALDAELLNGLRRLILLALDNHDLYASQNLLILADEFGLDEHQQRDLHRQFFGPSTSEAEFAASVDQLLADDRLRADLAAGDRARVALYRKIEQRPRDPQTLLDYRAATGARRQLRLRLGLGDEADARLQLRMEAVKAHYRRLCPLE